MSPQEIFEKMYAQDAFSQWLGIELLSVGLGECALRMCVRPEMVNGFGVAHGGITFSLADSAFAFACNSQGRHAVSVHCTVEHAAAVFPGDILTATATEDHLGNSLSNYSIVVENQKGQKVAFFRGLSFRKKKEWSVSS